MQTLLGLRNRLLSSRRFQFHAARFWPTRWVAARRARALFDLCAGFVYSQVLHACVRLDCFELLAERPLPLAEFGARCGLSPDAARRLVDAAVSIDLFQRTGDDRVALGIHGAAMRADPAFAAMIRHNTMFYRDLADPVALLRDEGRPTELQRFWHYARAPAPGAPEPCDDAGYSELMSSTVSLVLEDTLDAIGDLRFSHWVDIGGGEGVFACALASRFPERRFGVFDMPGVAARAAARIARAGLGGRVETFAGDFHRDALPRDADAFSLVRVLHDHDDVGAAALLSRIASALPAGGSLLLSEPMADRGGRDRMAQAYLNLYLHAMGSGRTRSVGRIRAMLEQAGFSTSRALRSPRPLLNSVILATR
ncbi:MAG: methyltransferase [Lautropia sp.]